MYLTEIEHSIVEEIAYRLYPLWYSIHFPTLKRGRWLVVFGWFGCWFGDWVDLAVGILGGLQFVDWVEVAVGFPFMIKSQHVASESYTVG